MSSPFVHEVHWDAVTVGRSTASNIRIACIAVAAYDFFLTLPAEWRIYRGPRGKHSFRISPLLFFLVRYISVVLIIIGSYTFWRGPQLSDKTCSSLSLLPTVFKCLQAMVVQFIMGWRAYNLSRKSSVVLYSFTGLYLAVVSVQWFTNFFRRVVSRPGGMCSVVTQNHIQWVFYLCCVVWDVLALFVSLFYLSRIRTTSPFMAKLARSMCVDGLVYFVAMTAFNALNMILFLNTDHPIIQGYVVVAYTAAWIFSQRILINLNDSASRSRDGTRTVTVSVSNSAEELSMEVSSRIHSAQHQSGLSSRNPGHRYRQRVQGTIQSSSGEYLDSFIEIDIGPQSPVKSPSDEANQSGPSRERHDRGDEDSLFDMATDSGIDTNHNPPRHRDEGPLMTTRRF